MNNIQHGIIQSYKPPVSPGMVSSGLIMHLNTNDVASYIGSGSLWNDVSGNGNHAVLQNPNFNTAQGGHLVFNGSNTVATIANTLTLSNATIGAWIKRNGNQSIYTSILFTRSASASNICGMIFSNSANNIGIMWNNTIYYWATGLIPPDNQWCYVAITVDTNTVTVYLCQASGITSATLSFVRTAPVVLNPLRVGSDSVSYPRIFNGGIAQIQMYNRALSSAEVTQNFNHAKSIFSI